MLWWKELPNEEIVEFFKLISDGNLKEVKARMKKQPSLLHARYRSNDYITTLMAASICPQPIDMLTLLLERKPQLSARDMMNRHLLLYACECGAQLDTVKFIFNHPLALERKSFQWSHCNASRLGVLPLACRSKNLPLLQYLLSIAPEQLPVESNGFDKQLTEVVVAENDEFALGWLQLPRVHEYIRAQCNASREFFRKRVRQACESKLYCFTNGLANIGPAYAGYVVASYCRMNIRLVERLELRGALGEFKYQQHWKYLNLVFLVLYKGKHVPTLNADIIQNICSCLYAFDVDKETCQMKLYSDLKYCFNHELGYFTMLRRTYDYSDGDFTYAYDPHDYEDDDYDCLDRYFD